MKKYIILSLFCLINSYVFCQELPKYYIVNNDTIGLILSIDQVKRIKNDLELKIILDDMRISCDSTISKFIVVVDNYEKKIVSLDKTIYKLDSSDINNKEVIKSLNESLNLQKRDKFLCDSASLKKDTIIQNSETIISSLKCKRNLGYGGTILFFITTLIFLAL